jgi:hypothetical protein
MWEHGEEGRRQARRGGTAAESRDPALRLPVLNEIASWIERELAGGVGLRTGVIWRGEHQHFARQNANQPFDAFTVPVTLRDPGPDGVAGSADDGPTLRAYDLGPEFAELPPVNIVRNVAGSSSEYWTWEIAATRRARGRWSFGGGFAHTWNRDQAQGYSGQALRNNTYPLTPNDLINATHSRPRRCGPVSGASAADVLWTVDGGRRSPEELGRRTGTPAGVDRGPGGRCHVLNVRVVAVEEEIGTSTRRGSHVRN